MCYNQLKLYICIFFNDKPILNTQAVVISNNAIKVFVRSFL